MRLVQMILSVAAVLVVGCGSMEESASSDAESLSTAGGFSEAAQGEEYQPGDCCYADCVISRGGGVGFCEANIGKPPYGECTSRTRGYCQLKGKTFAYATWGRCGSRSGSRLRPTSRGLRLYGLPGSADFSMGRGQGFSSCLTCPCHRAVALTPPKWLIASSSFATRHAAFAQRSRARP